MRRPSRSLAASLFFLTVAPAGAATVLERAVDVEIPPDGSVTERTHLRVRLDSPTDFDEWSPYRVYLDQNRTLDALTAAAITPDGKTLDVGRRDLDTEEAVGSGELHSSRKFRAVRFPRVPAGSVLAVDAAVRIHPYFPGGMIHLGQSEAIESLRAVVHGAGAGWRWRLDGTLPGLDVKEIPGGVTVAGHHLPRRPPLDLAPESADDGPVLRYAWGNGGGWEDVGSWYDHLVADLPRDAAPVHAKAVELTGGLTGKREKIAALLAFVRRQVRYVAVEVGIGGYRPGTPQDVLTRRWGDCKDKAFLLVDLLRGAGIEAYPVLILSAERDRVDREFPAPQQFNHVIAAVPADDLGTAPEDPVASGYLFLDATQTSGGLAWLHPGAQDQEALVVRGGRGVPVHTPIRQEKEKVRLALDVTAAADGQLTGTARVEVTGDSGAAFVDLIAAGKPDEVDRVVRRIFARYLPGVKMDDPRWTVDEKAVPAAVLTANVRLPAPPMPPSPEGWPAYTLPPLAVMPSLGVLDDRTLPVVATPSTEELSWSVTLAAGACPPAPGQDVQVSNALGSYSQKVSLAGTKLTVERRSELRKRWIEPADFPALKEVALAESRTGKRRLRWECR